MVALMKKNIKNNHTNYEILQILSLTLLNKTPVSELFDEGNQQNLKELDCNQLVLF
jgi:hypothetical protein